MIIQFNILYDQLSRQRGSRLYYHWNDGTTPTDNQIIKLLYDRYLNEYEIKDKSTWREFIVTSGGRDAFEVFPIFCTYDKDKNIVEEGLKKISFGPDGWYTHFGYELGI